MKKLIITNLLLIFLVVGICFASDKYLVADFASGSIKVPQEWWVFDVHNTVSKDGLMLSGKAKNYYAGGVGTYIAKDNTDLSQYNTIQLDIWGNGEKSGTLKIELHDDDNNNWRIEQDEKNNFAPTKDDRFTYDQVVDWKGWQTIQIPIGDFVDDNPDVGDGIMNFEQKDGSGGLLQMQFICSATTDKGEINLGINNIYLVKNVIK
jgi:hypothetical protein